MLTSTNSPPESDRPASPRARLTLHDLFQRRTTATLLVVSATLSICHLLGAHLTALLPTYPEWRREPWRLLTATLLHVNAVHLLFNLYWTAILGAIVESVCGAFFTAALFLLLGVTSSAAELAVFDGGIGLSGIGYGLFGFLWTIQRSDPRFRGALDRRTVEAFVLWFFLCIALTYSGTMRVANLAHASGAIVGALMGWVASAPGTRGLLRSVPLVLLVLLIALACTVGRPYVKQKSSLAWEYAHDGWEALDAGQDERAATILKRSLAIDPDSYSAWWNLGLALWHLHSDPEALDAFDRSCAQMRPTQEHLEFLVHAKTYVAELEQKDGRNGEAETLLQQALDLEPNDAHALNLLAYLRETSGARDEAVKLYEKAGREGPAEDWAKQRLSTLKAGR